MTYWKSPRHWERLRAEGEEGVRGWDDWMASLMHKHRLGQTPGDGQGQGGLACSSPWVHKESDTTGWLTTTTTVHNSSATMSVLYLSFKSPERFHFHSARPLRYPEEVQLSIWNVRLDCLPCIPAAPVEASHMESKLLGSRSPHVTANNTQSWDDPWLLSLAKIPHPQTTKQWNHFCFKPSITGQ